MDDYFRLKTTRTKPRQSSAPQRQDKRKQWERTDKRTQSE